MSDDNRWTDKIDNEILELIWYNFKNIEAKTPRMLIKIADINNSEADRLKEMSNIKFGI